MESDKIISYTIERIFEQIWMSKNSYKKVQSFNSKLNLSMNQRW